MDNIVIDRPERLEEDISDFKIDAVEAEKNFTTARLRVCRKSGNRGAHYILQPGIEQEF